MTEPFLVVYSVIPSWC